MPEPIDRDALMRKHTTSFAHDNTHNTAEELHFLLECIRTAPIIEPEVRHGWWIEDGEICGIDKYKCSLCGGEVGGLLDNTKYCCFCGARMDEGAINATD